MLIHLLLEGRLEEPVAEKVLTFCGHAKGTVYGRQGFGYIGKKAAGFYSMASTSFPILVLTDFMDTGAPCPPEALRKYLGNEPSKPSFLCRFAVNELESWLLADRQGMADFLHIPLAKTPLQPDDEADPKKTLVALARKSRKRDPRDSIVPPGWHKGSVAPDYLATMTEFVISHWNIASAMEYSPSLQRCVSRLQQLAS